LAVLRHVPGLFMLCFKNFRETSCATQP